MNTFLNLKTMIPELNNEVVKRERLNKYINKNLNHNDRFLLVSAPAGYGKTTVITDWLKNIKNKKNAWLTLDNEENNVESFILGIISSFQKLNINYFKGTKEFYTLPSFSGYDSLLSSFFEELRIINEDIILVIDDYHCISNNNIHNIMDKIIKYLPSNITLLLLTREDPQIMLNNYRLQGKLVELRAEDLKFKDDEIINLFNKMGIDINKEDISILSGRTEGWVSGVKLAAVKMLGKDKNLTHEFIENFSGSNFYIMDYLIEEVLKDLDTDIKSFLYKTSIVDEFSPDLCNYLTERTDSFALIQKLIKLNLFVTELDLNSNWFRYHQLFKDSLKFHLNNNEQISLYRKASRWFLDHNYYKEAVYYAKKADDYNLAVDYINESIPSLLKSGEIRKILKLLEDIPDQFIKDSITVLIIKAWSLFATGDKKGALYYIKLIDQRDKISNRDRGRLLTLTSMIPEINNNSDPTILAKEAVKLVDDNDYIFKINAWMTLGQIQASLGRLNESIESFEKAYFLGRETNQTFLEIISLTNLVLKMNQKGKLQEAYNLCESNIERYSSNNKIEPLARLLYISKGIFLYHMGKYKNAKEYLIKGIEIAEQLNLVHVAWMPKIFYAKSCFENGEIELAYEIIEELLVFTKKYNLKPNYEWAELIKDEFELKNNINNFSELDLKRYNENINNQGTFHHFKYLLNYIRYLLIKNKPEEVINLIDEYKNHDKDYVDNIKIKLFLSFAYQLTNDDINSKNIFKEVLKLISYEKYLDVFISEYELIKPIINKYSDLAPHFTKLIESKLNKKIFKVSNINQEKLIDPLTEREIEILELVSKGLSNKKISEELYITLGTTKWHLSNIYSKLEVKNRTKASLKAKKLNIIK